MPDFRTLLKKPAGEIKRPPLLPAGTYLGVIKPGHNFGESSNKKTPYIEYTVALTSPGEDIPPELMVSDGKQIDLSKRSFRSTFYLTDDALFRLKEFIETFGTAIPADADLEAHVSEPEGKPCICTIGIGTNSQSGEPFNEMKKVVGVV